MTDPTRLPRYDIGKSYAWNYDHPPPPVEVEVPRVPGEWDFCGLAVDSPLGMPAGPLLCGEWILYYASLGFDVLTYKTVRSGPRPCYPLPNLQPIHCGSLHGGETKLPATDGPSASWAVSFGMPSQSPDVWRADIEATRRKLPAGKLLPVSVVGTIRDGWTIDDLGDDYAACARWAVESGADAVETNFSCPNVSTCDGQLYQQPESAALVASKVREAIGCVPYIAKIGHVNEDETALALLEALAPHVDSLAMTNSVAATIVDAEGRLLFDGQPRGICGEATREASTSQTRRFAHLIDEHGLGVRLIGVGGAGTAADVREYLDAGAHAVHVATAAMLNPAVAIEIRRELAAE